MPSARRCGTSCFRAYFRLYFQPKVCPDGIAAIGRGHNGTGKALILAAFPELYAILTVAATYLTVAVVCLLAGAI